MSRRWRIRTISLIILAGLIVGFFVWGEELLVKLFWPKRDRDVIYAPTPPEAVDKMLEMAGVTKDDVVYDLGSGDGRILIAAAKKYGCRAVGWEIDPKLVDESRRNAEAAGVGHLVQINHGDIFKVDLSECTVLAIYLLPELNVRLKPQIRKMRPGSRVVSFAFDMPGVPPKDVVKIRTEKGKEYTMYLWFVPLPGD